MSIDELMLVHIWLIFWIGICVWYIWGNGAEQSYESRMKLSKWLMPGRFSDKDYYVMWVRRLAALSLPLGIIIYCLFIFK